MRSRVQAAALLITGVLIGSLVVTPVGAHFIENTRHLGVHAWTEFIRDRVYTRAQTHARFYTKGQTYSRAQIDAAIGGVECLLVQCVPQVPDHAGIVGTYTSIAIAPDGNPTISYNANGDLKVVHCDDPFCAGTESPQTVDSEGLVGTWSSLAIAPDGHPTISYRDSTNTALKVVHCDDPFCAGAESPQTVDDDGDVGQHTSIAIAPDGNPTISYYSPSNTALKVVHCDDPACAGMESPEFVDAIDNVGMWSSIAIATDGNPIISYFDATNEVLKVVHCDDPACEGGESPEFIQDGPGVGPFSSIVIAPDGNPTISYQDSVNDDLMVVHCDDPDCALADAPSVADSFGEVGAYSSIAIAPDGYPVVSYWDASFDDLKVVHCDDPECAGGEAPRVVDSIGDVGQHTSIAIGSDGIPTVSYYDADRGNLKVVRPAF